MVQDILTYTLIVSAISVIIFRTVKLFIPAKQKHGGDCCSSSGCHDCNLKEIDSGIRYHKVVKHTKIIHPVISKN